jgi:hypothetical protein
VIDVRLCVSPAAFRALASSVPTRNRADMAFGSLVESFSSPLIVLRHRAQLSTRLSVESAVPCHLNPVERAVSASDK